MNPMVVAAGAKAVESGKATELLHEIQRPAKTVMTVVLVVLAIVVLWWLTKNWREKWQAAQFNNVDMGKNPKEALARTYANRIEAALSWYNDNEEAIYQVGREMKITGVSFGLVANAYKAGFQGDLAQKLSSRLNSSELRKFYAAAGLASLTI